MNLGKVFRYLLYLLFLVVPLFILPAAFDSYIITKWTILKVGILILALSFMTQSMTKSFARFLQQSSLIRILLLFFLVQGLTLVYSQSKELAIQELLKWFFLILLYVLIFRLIRTSNHLQSLRDTLLLAGGLTAGWVILQDYHIVGLDILARLPDWRGYLVAGMGNSDYVAGFLASIVPLGVMSYLVETKASKSILYLLFLSVACAALIVTYSVGSNGGLLLGLIVMGIVYFRNGKIHSNKFLLLKKKLSIALVLLLFVTAFYVIPNPWNGRGQSIFQQAFASKRWKEGGSTRVVIWLNTWEVIKSHPILGVGTGNFTYRYLDGVSPKVLANPEYRFYAGEYTNSAHNELLQTWLESGIVGALLLVLLIVQYFRLAKRALKESDHPQDIGLILGSIGGMVALIGYGLMSYPLHLPSAAISFVFILSIPSVVSGIRQQQATPDTPWVQVQAIPVFQQRLRIYLGLVLICILSFWVSLPLWGDIKFREGKTALAYGDVDMAMDSFEVASRLGNHADAQYNLAELLVKQGRFDEATRYYLLSAQQRKDKNIYQGLAIVYYFQNQPRQSIGYLEQLVRRNPDNPETWKFLWMAYIKAGDMDKAKQAHQKMNHLLGIQ
jgi:O-antigen ligase/Flp pilus assembly protein TadD